MAKIRIIQPNGLTIEIEDDDYEMLSKLVSLYHQPQTLLYESEFSVPLATKDETKMTASSTDVLTENPAKKTFEFAITSWLDYIGAESNNAGTLKKYSGYAKSVLEIVGAELNISDITPSVVAETRKKIINYPKNRWSARNVSKPLSELMSNNALPKISRSTAKEYMRILKSVLEHMYTLDLIQKNPAKNIHIGRGGISSNVERVPFTNEDLIKIFNGSIYHGNDYIGKMRLLDAYFWAPLIALYMGLRVAEIAQLTIADINVAPESWHGKVFDIPYISVDDKEDFQSIKNENSRRKVPIHKNIIEIGFVDYVKSRLAAENGNSRTMLFEHLIYQQNGAWGRKISRWFCGDGGNRVSGFRNSVGITDNEGKVFHSFRHTFIDMLRNTSCKDGGEYITAIIVGHEVNSSTSLYGSGLQLDTLQKYVDSVCYSDEVENLVKSLSFSDFQQKVKRFWRR